MKKFIVAGLMGLSGIVFTSCEDENLIEKNGEKIEIQFESSQKEVDENGVESSVVLVFSRPAPADIIIALNAGTGYENVLNTTPKIENGMIALQVRKGDTSAEIKLHPVNNSQRNGNRILDLKLNSPPPPFIAGMKKSLDITIKDDETLNQAIANFIHQDITLQETNTAGIDYQIHFSEALASAGEIKITLSSEKALYGAHFVTEPAAQENTITLPLAAGIRVIAFKVRAIDNQDLTGDLDIKFNISQTSELITRGDNVEQTLTIRDEELAGKPKGYEVTAGNVTLKKFYEYDTEGRISKVNWESYAPYHTHGTDTYFYDAAGRIEKINKHAFKDIIYHWENGRIVRSEEVSDGIMQSYTQYDYDDAGNVGGVVSYYRQDNGEFLKGLFTIYLYFLDGNLYKSLTYNDAANPEEPQLVRTRTYENYIDVSNPFPMTEILPGVKTQTKLPTTYRSEEAGTDLTYQIAYEYRPDGLPGKRIATAQGDLQTAVYHYY